MHIASTCVCVYLHCSFHFISFSLVSLFVCISFVCRWCFFLSLDSGLLFDSFNSNWSRVVVTMSFARLSSSVYLLWLCFHWNRKKIELITIHVLRFIYSNQRFYFVCFAKCIVFCITVFLVVCIRNVTFLLLFPFGW